MKYYLIKISLVILLIFALAACPSPIASGQVPCGEDAHCPQGQICLGDGFCGTEEMRPTGCVSNEECPQGICENGFCTTDISVDEGSILSLDPGNDIDFGSPALGVAIEKTLSVKNVGPGPFSILDARLAADTSDEFVLEIATPGPWVVEAGGQLDILLGYTLADGEEDLGALLLTTTAERCELACDNPNLIQVDFFSEFKGERNLGLSPSNIDFGYVGIGQTSTPESILISNDGTLDKILTVTEITLEGPTQAYQYTLPSVPLYLLPGQSIPIEFVYAPADCDDHLVTMTVRANSDSPELQQLSATLSATAPPPNPLVFDPPTLVFDQIEVGSSQTLTSTLKLVGCDPVTLSSGQMVSGQVQPFQANLASGLPYTLEPGGTVIVNVTYAPNQGGTDVDTYQVYAQGIAAPVTLPVAGQNYVPPTVSITTLPESLSGSSCACTGGSSIANVDVSLNTSPSGPVCKKPYDPQCGFNGGTCDCNMGSYGSATWRAFNQVEDIMIEEEIVFEGATGDATFIVKANLLDDCHAFASSRAAVYGCCFADCESTQGCAEEFEYYQGIHCPTYCDSLSYSLAGSGCMYRGPVPVRTTVKIPSDGSAGARIFCTTLNGAGTIKDVVTLTQASSGISISQIHSGVTEISPGQSCP